MHFLQYLLHRAAVGQICQLRAAAQEWQCNLSDSAAAILFAANLWPPMNQPA
jgi:hypothetical protein